MDSEHYTDGSVDKIHLAADVIDETKLEDNSLDSEHYNDASIDPAHLNIEDAEVNLSLLSYASGTTNFDWIAATAFGHEILALADAAALLAKGGVTATASEINTPLDGASVTLTEFQELETIGDNTISADQWAGVGASTTYGIALMALADEAALQALITNPWTVPDGGTGASSLIDGGVILGSGTGTVTPMAVLADSEMIVGDGTTDPVAESGATLRTSIGVGTGDSPQLTGIELSHATENTLTGSSGILYVEGDALAEQDDVDTKISSVSGDTEPALGGPLNMDGNYIYEELNAFTDQDATPDVGAGYNFKTANTVATTITDFVNAQGLLEGHQIFVLINDSYTTIDFTSSGLNGHGGVDWDPSANDSMNCTYDGDDWNCIVSRPSTLSNVVIGGFTANQFVRADDNGDLLSANPSFIAVDITDDDYTIGTDSLTTATCAYGETYMVKRTDTDEDKDIIIPDICDTKAASGDYRNLTICEDGQSTEKISIALHKDTGFYVMVSGTPTVVEDAVNGQELDSPYDIAVPRTCIRLICDFDGYWSEFRRSGSEWTDGGDWD